MNLDVHIFGFNEERILKYAFRHYATFCERMVLHDAFSTDGSRALAKSAGAEIVDWDTKGEINDELLMKEKNICWLGTKADWVIVVDADELVFLPEGDMVLQTYIDHQTPVVKLHGFEMLSLKYPTTEGQIYDEVFMGSPEPQYGSKPALFTPHLVKSISFGAGAHDCTAELHDGTQFVSPSVPTLPPTWLLHYHHIGPTKDIAARYDAHRARMSAVNKAHNWGCQIDGATHALKKLNQIRRNIRQIINP